MEHNEDLARLEQFVEKLLDSHNQLKNENSEINEQLRAKQQEITELQEMIKNLQNDRSVVHNRVTGLIDRIDEWEKTFEHDESEKNSATGDGGKENPPKKSSTLFNVTAEQSSESAVS
ncbi:MAG: cell division protein ZapB, partial [Deltaproteobacteria bacterium]|jgi:chromosome segregation ATPase